jgi:CO dehydrogenase maturation factor
MATTIAISGKGGSGKTTVAGMIVRSLLAKRQTSEDRKQKTDEHRESRIGHRAILAVDADPNSCLGLTMGVEPVGTIAELREKVRGKAASNAGMDRVRSFEYGMQQAITEADGFDLLTMGRPEGPDCYCAVNNMLRTFLNKLSSQYGFVIIDNEAGMEHLSRRTTNNVDLLGIVTEQTPLGEVTAGRIFQLAKHLPISVKEIGVIWNRAENNKDLDGIEIFGHIPFDQAVFDASMQNKTIFELEENNPALLAVRKILEHKLKLVRQTDGGLV